MLTIHTDTVCCLLSTSTHYHNSRRKKKWNWTVVIQITIVFLAQCRIVCEFIPSAECLVLFCSYDFFTKINLIRFYGVLWALFAVVSCAVHLIRSIFIIIACAICAQVPHNNCNGPHFHTTNCNIYLSFYFLWTVRTGPSFTQFTV